jgi:predicted nicotinamide N-methyase
VTVTVCHIGSDRKGELVEHVVPLPGRELLVLAPRAPEALLSEEAFAVDEFMPYWAELWPSAVALARVLARRPLTGRRVLELGCGLGLPALAAAVAGGRVLATDWAPESVAMTARNAEHNGLAVATAVFRWDADPASLGPPWPLVLASDVLYERRNVTSLLSLLPRLTAAAGEVWLADPGRAFAVEFVERAGASWRLDAIPHDGPAHVTVHRLRAQPPVRSPGTP